MDIILSDIEGTLTTGSSWRALGKYFMKHDNQLAYYLFLLRWLPRFPFVKMGLIDKRKGMRSWMESEINLLKGRTRQDIEETAAWIVKNEMWPKRRQDVIQELVQHQSEGARIILVSSAYQPFVTAFAHRLGAEAIGTPLLFNQDVLSGLTIPINAYQQKAENILTRIKEGNIVAAYGDTASDIPMMELSENPIAVYPSRELRKEADCQGWRIIEDHGAP